MKKCKSFSELAGGENFHQRLQKEALGNTTQTIVLSGPSGIGKSTWANALAVAWLCQNPSENGACCRCSSCAYFDEGTHPDFQIIEAESKGKTIPIDDIRRKIHAEVEIRPQISSYRVWIIDADALMESAQNALLKVLEEPPTHARFILTVVDKAKLLPTLMSRAVHISIPRLDPPQLKLLLNKRVQLRQEELDFAIGFSQGIPGLALQIVEKENFPQLRKQCEDWFLDFPGHNEARLLTEDYQFFDDNKVDLETIFLLLQSMFRDYLLVSKGQEKNKLLQNHLAEPLRKMVDTYPIDSRALAGIDRLLNDTQQRLRANANFEMSICRMLLMMREELKHAWNRRRSSSQSNEKL